MSSLTASDPSSRTVPPRASVYYRVGGTSEASPLHVPEEVSPTDAERAIANLPAYSPSEPDIDSANLRMSAARRIFEPTTAIGDDDDDVAAPMAATSWRVSDDEFIIKIDASPLHMSAARRMFDKQKRASMMAGGTTPAVVVEGLEEDGDDYDAPPSVDAEKHESEWKQFWNKMMKVYTAQK